MVIPDFLLGVYLISAYLLSGSPPLQSQAAPMYTSDCAQATTTQSEQLQDASGNDTESDDDVRTGNGPVDAYGNGDDDTDSDDQDRSRDRDYSDTFIDGASLNISLTDYPEESNSTDDSTTDSYNGYDNSTEPDEYDEDTPGDLCWDEYVRCWNESYLRPLTQPFALDEVFDPYTVTNETIGKFCNGTFPAMANCMAMSNLTRGRSLTSGEMDPFLRNCTDLIRTEAKLDKSEIDEISQFYRSYRYLCSPDVQNWCFNLKQRACIIELEKEGSAYCDKACDVEKSPYRGHPYVGQGHRTQNNIVWSLLVVGRLLSGHTNSVVSTSLRDSE